MRKTPKEKPPQLTVGRRERIDLPDLNLMHIPAKVDTGAYSCSVHADELLLVEENGRTYLEALLIGHNWEGFHGEWKRFEHWKRKKVKNSFGVSEERYVIRTHIVLFGRSYLTDFTLSNREKMTYPILLGRKLLKDNNFLVDVNLVDNSKAHQKTMSA